MVGLLAALAALLGIACVPLALAGGTAWMVLPAHLVLTGLCVGGTVLSGLGGRPSMARAFGVGHVLISVCVAVALAVGSEARGDSWYWFVPFGVPLLWVWLPGALSTVTSEIGVQRRQSRNRRAVRRRRKRPARQASTAPENSET